MDSFLNYIFKAGTIYEKHSAEEKKTIILFNTGCLCCYLIVLFQIGLGIFNNLNNYRTLYPNLILGVFIAQVIHSKQYFNTGRLLFICYIIFFIFINSNYLFKGKLLEVFLLLIPGTSIILFDNKYINVSVFILCVLTFAVPNIYFQNYPSINLLSPIVIYLFFCFI